MSNGIDPGWRPETRLVRAGRKAPPEHGAVNPPIQRGSTVLLPSVAALHGDGKTYGLEGFEVHDALSEALAGIVSASGAVLAPSGLAACTLALLASVRAGDDILVVDSVYGPTRRFCDGLLAQFGVTTRYYDPRIGAQIADLFQANTRAVFLESPGSLTMEVQDTPAICSAARAHGVTTIIDDTWSAGVYFNPFEHGVDLSVQAVTKYQGGHADVLLGAVLALQPDTVQHIRAAAKQLGLGCGAPEDAYLALRGLRTMPLRLDRQCASALTVARWLQARPEVARVLHPALPSHPDHAVFARDFSGSAGVFACILHPTPERHLHAFLESLRLFGLGFSWGGYESLITHCDPQLKRTAVPWRAEGPLIRLSVGLEHPDDLIDDLEQGLAQLATPA